MMMQWRKSLWWWSLRPASFAPGWGDTSAALAGEFSDRPMRIPRAPAAAGPARRFWQATASFMHEQFCDVATLRAAPTDRAPLMSDTPPVRYRHPRTGQPWSGAGRQPQWVRDALLVEGWLLADLRDAAQRAETPACTAPAAAH